MKYNYKFARITSFAGIAVNNIKANTGDLTITINGGNYKLTGGVDDSITSIENLLNALSSQKLTGTSSLTLTPKLKEYYFLKSLTKGDGSTDEEVSMDANLTIKLTEGKKADIELVKKGDRINIKYDDATVKGARLTKDKEKEILEKIIQGKGTNDLGISNIEFKIGSLTQASTSGNVIGKDINLFATDEKVKFEITKITGDYKKVVCNFADDTESKLVKRVDLEKLCDALKSSDNGLKQSGRNLAGVLTGLNECKVIGINTGFFKNLAGVSIKKDGDDATENKITDENVKDFAAANFVVVDGIKKENINAKFLKKTFKVELDTTNNDKTIGTKADALNDALNKALGDNVKITTVNIWNVLKTESAIITNTFSGNIKTDKGNNNLVNKTFNDNSDDLVDDTTTEFVIKLPEAAFASNVVETKIKITYDSIDNKELNGKKVKKTVIDAIKKIIDETTTKTSKVDFVGKFNSDGTIDKSSNFADTDFDFINIVTGSDIDKSGKLGIKDEFWNKLTDKCFDDKSDDEANKGENTKDSNGTKDGSETKDGNKDAQKGCCGSNKK